MHAFVLAAIIAASGAGGRRLTEAAPAVTFDGGSVSACIGDCVNVTWNGYHNIAFETGSLTHVVHGFEAAGHVETVCDLGVLTGAQRKYFCTLHPDKVFYVTCGDEAPADAEAVSPVAQGPVRAGPGTSAPAVAISVAICVLLLVSAAT